MIKRFLNDSQIDIDKHPKSAIAEAMRKLRTYLNFCNERIKNYFDLSPHREEKHLLPLISNNYYLFGQKKLLF